MQGGTSVCTREGGSRESIAVVTITDQSLIANYYHNHNYNH